MTPCFGDTFLFLALLAEGDAAHKKAVQAIADLKRDIYTTTWVLTEVADGIAGRDTRSAFVPLLQFLQSHPRVVIVPTTDDIFDRGVDLYGNRPDKDWSLTDCISFVVMQERGITEALTGDHHFEQAGFTALLK
ncbi:MAG: PIN domain-containing protein [Phycisphaerae bacterium]|jgi:predicted nucleic acid-binding protein|nr:PIN domain-containing protein [Phycisphaerae bacterium]